MADRSFEYLLNAMEAAAQADEPAKQNYRAKREAVMAYVAALVEDVARLRVDAAAIQGHINALRIAVASRPDPTHDRAD